jgi:hypothetical protein
MNYTTLCRNTGTYTKYQRELKRIDRLSLKQKRPDQYWPDLFKKTVLNCNY